MWYQVFIPAPVLMIPILVMTTKGTHSPKNDSNLPSDVIVTYSNHAEAHNDYKVPVVTEKSTTTATVVVTNYYGSGERNDYKSKEYKSNDYKSKEYKSKEYKSKTKNDKNSRPKANRPRKESGEVVDPLQEDVVFIPNERDREVVRNEYYLQNDRASIQDLMGGHKTVDDLLAAKDVRLETESPVSDIIFVMGKNNDHIEHPEKDRESKRLTEDRIKEREGFTLSPKLNCSNLNCNNAIKSVCGEKIENFQPKIRLFLNDCYFRKVNCNFKNAANRYKKVALSNCKNIGAHNQTPFSFKPPQPKPIEKLVLVNNTRRTSASSRRSMTMNIHGQFCSHACPASCPELYEPECAVSSTGRHRVFVNHCALDHNSCSFGIVWHSVPLAECVGGKKAEMRQSAGFIGWMQRVGIVDNRGRLVYDVDTRR